MSAVATVAKQSVAKRTNIPETTLPTLVLDITEISSPIPLYCGAMFDCLMIFGC